MIKGPLFGTVDFLLLLCVLLWNEAELLCQNQLCEESMATLNTVVRSLWSHRTGRIIYSRAQCGYTWKTSDFAAYREPYFKETAALWTLARRTAWCRSAALRSSAVLRPATPSPGFLSGTSDDTERKVGRDIV